MTENSMPLDCPGLAESHPPKDYGTKEHPMTRDEFLADPAAQPGETARARHCTTCGAPPEADCGRPGSGPTVHSARVFAGSVLPLRGSQGTVPAVVRDGLPDLRSGASEPGELIDGRPEPHDLAAGVVETGTAGAGSHGPDYRGYGKSLTTPSYEATVNPSGNRPDATPEALMSDDIDRESSVSRQHYIDTGQYLTVQEVEEIQAQQDARASASPPCPRCRLTHAERIGFVLPDGTFTHSECLAAGRDDEVTPLDCPRSGEPVDTQGEPHVPHEWHVYSPLRYFWCSGYTVPPIDGDGA